MGETFLAFTRGPHPANDGRGGEVRIEAGVIDDIAKEIDEKNGWVEPGERAIPVSEETINLAAEGLSELILFCFEGQTLDPYGKGMRTVIRRFVSVCWILKSQALLVTKKKGKSKVLVPISLAKLGKQPQVRCTRCTLSLLAQEFGRRWGFRARVQKKETTKPNYAKAAKIGWKKRRSREAIEQRRTRK